MNNDAPETLAAARSRAAELEQQLKLSDEGVSRLAQRCLELEQQVLNYQAALARHGSDNEPAALTLPQLFYDSGSGFSPRECLTVAEDAYDELTHEVSAVFTLPTDARALRLDPGELACCVTDLSISDERLECRAMNGIQLQEDCLLFLDVDPNLTVQSTVPFAAGMKFAVTYHYYPLGRFQHEQPGKALLQALSAIKLRAEAEQNDLRGQLQAALAENTWPSCRTAAPPTKTRWKTCTKAAAGGSLPRCVRCTGCSVIDTICRGVSLCTQVTAPCSVNS